MPVQFKIRITKEILAACKHCGSDNDPYEIGSNCAIALALQDFFPNVYVSNYKIFPFGIYNTSANDMHITLPVVAQQFVQLFDGFRTMPRLRLLLPEFEFTINLPDEILETINIDEVKQLTSSNKKTGITVFSY